MNKIHYFAVMAIGTMMLAGCSSEEVIDAPAAPTQAIGFKAMANKSGRAEVTTTNIERFRVFGCSQEAGKTGTEANHLVLFDDVTVKREVGENNTVVWTYSPLQYWTANRDYYFIALSTNNTNPVWKFTAPATHNANMPADNTFKGYGTVTTSIVGVDDAGSEINAERDLVYAVAARNTDANITNTAKVAFAFNHMLSRIGLTFKNEFTNPAYSFTISDITISGLIAEGSVDLGVEPANLDWNATEGVEAATIRVSIPNNNNVAKDASAASDYRFIIPGVQELAIEFNVTVKLNNTVYSKRTMNGTITLADGYKPGKSYMFKATVNEDNIIPAGAKPIEFTVTAVSGWGNDVDGDVTIPTTPAPTPGA